MIASFPFVNHAGETFWTISVWTYGRLEIQFLKLSLKPPFASEATRLELLDRLNAIDGVSIARDRIDKRPSVPLQLMTQPEALERFLEVLDWLVGEIRAI